MAWKGHHLVRVRILKNNLPSLVGMLPREAREARHRIAQEVFNIAQTTVPVASGELRDSGGIRAHGQGYNVGYSARHAPWVHDGTVHMEARPWLQLAATEVIPSLRAEIKYLRDTVMKTGSR